MEVRLLTYNVFMRPYFIKTNKSDYKSERLKQIGRSVLPHYDIVCFEEMFDTLTHRRHSMLKMAQKAGFGYFVQSDPPSFGRSSLIDGGLLILSRYPIVESAFLSFRQGVTSDSLPDKGVLFARVQVSPQHVLNIFHTHLQASYVVEEVEQSLPNYYVRIRQFALMRAFIAEKLELFGRNGELSLLVGDFNIDANFKQYPSAHLERLLGKERYFEQNRLANEYDLFMNAYNAKQLSFSTTDLFLHARGTHPITYADAVPAADGHGELPAETMLTGKEDYATKQCLDYIFLVEPRNARMRPTLFVNSQSLRVEKFNENVPNVSQLSDHYGLSCVVCSMDYLNRNYALPQTQNNFLMI